MSKNKKTKTITFAIEMTVAYILCIIVSVFEANNITDWNWFEFLYWPFSSLGWFIITPIAGIIFLILAFTTFSLAVLKKSVLPFVASLTVLCAFWVGWSWMVWQFHD
jgi:hypothetical protein